MANRDMQKMMDRPGRFNWTPPCMTSFTEGQYVFVQCAETGCEMVWSPSEAGTYEEVIAEHQQAHDDQEWRRERARLIRNVRYTYAHTEAGSPARRGLGNMISAFC